MSGGDNLLWGAISSVTVPLCKQFNLLNSAISCPALHECVEDLCVYTRVPKDCMHVRSKNMLGIYSLSLRYVTYACAFA